MEHQQTTDYIRQHLSSGHSESTIRQHFLSSGWTQQAVDDAFTHYHHSVKVVLPAESKAPRRKPSWLKRPKWSAARWVKTIVVATSIIAIVCAGIAFQTRTRPVVTPPAPKLSDNAKRAIDINTIAGAVGQYVTANGAMPTVASPSPEGSLQLCSDVSCDPATSQVSSLAVYKASNIKLMAYQASLTAPNTSAVYLVQGAKCNGRVGIGDPNPSPRSMVILYAIATDPGTAQRCVAL